MKIAQFKTSTSGNPQLGMLYNDQLINLGELAQAAHQAGRPVAEWQLAIKDAADLITRGNGAIDEIRTLVDWSKENGHLSLISLDSVEFLPPVFPGKILAIGRNYVDHSIEQGEEPPKAPLLFNKLTNSLSAHNAPIVLPAISSKVDYEAELAVVIGKRATRVSEAEALDYVFGYTPFNDVSARDLQFGDGQWTRGKGLDGFAPLGPFITTRDEIPDVHSLKIEGRLNGAVMQSSNTARMIFKVPYLISYLSQGITLEPGDVIATGTPEGVGIFRKPPVLLKPGDVYEVTIEKLGTLRNPVRE
jgi:2-keto-4-pentenoate hydratase/2-oxohepta-3-ene-1,7-dioic acid hydratase in catechol pathway